MNCVFGCQIVFLKYVPSHRFQVYEKGKMAPNDSDQAEFKKELGKAAL